MPTLKPITAAVGLAAALAMAPPNAVQAQDIVADSTIIRQVIAGNLLEIRLGELAEDKSDDSAVEEFARKIVEDHESMQRQWVVLARASRLPAESDLGPVYQSIVQRLEGLSGAEFDRAYLTNTIQNHQRDATTLRQASQSARSSQVRQVAAADLPTVQEHIATANELSRRVGAGTVATLPPGRIPAPDGRRRTGERADTGDPADTLSRRSPDDREITWESNRADDRVGARRDDARSDEARRDEARRNEARRDDRDARGRLSEEDRYFVREVLQDHVMHIRLAERAQRDAKSKRMRDFAKDLEEDLEDWQERWESVASSHGLQWSGNIGPMHRQKLEGLEKARKNDFDRVYAAIVVDHMESIVPYFQKEGKAVRSEAVRRLVEDELPAIRKHLANAKRLQRQEVSRTNDSDD